MVHAGDDHCLNHQPAFWIHFFFAGDRSIDQVAKGLLDCRLVDTVDAGDHTLFIGEALAADAREEGSPMTGWDYGKVYRGSS